jgi:hypothetical protein
MSKTVQDKPTFRLDLKFFDVRMKVIRERATARRLARAQKNSDRGDAMISFLLRGGPVNLHAPGQPGEPFCRFPKTVLSGTLDRLEIVLRESTAYRPAFVRVFGTPPGTIRNLSDYVTNQSRKSLRLCLAGLRIR